MTRKDFILIAEVLDFQMSAYASEPGSKAVLRATAERMADALATTNANFKRERFLTACGF